MYYIYHIRRDVHSNNLKEGYIGISNNPERRLKEHKKSGNVHLKRAFEKYTDIQMVVISEGSEDEMKRMEEWLRPEDKMGWNLVKGGGLPPRNSLKGYKHTEEMKKKISESKKGKPSTKKGKPQWSEEEKKRIGLQHKGKTLSESHLKAIRNEVEQYSLEGEFIQTFPSVKHAELSLGKTTSTNINNVCKGKMKQALGFIWKYVQ